MLLTCALPGGASGQEQPAGAPHEASAPQDESALRIARDQGVAARVRHAFSGFNELASVKVSSTGGVVRLEGTVPNPAWAQTARDIAAAHDGVLLVVSAELVVVNRIAPLPERIEAITVQIVDRVPLALLALLVVVLFAILGRLLSSIDSVYRQLIDAPLFRGIAKRGVNFVVLGIGILIALEILDATAVVGATLGAAGVAGLVLGFAFKDFVENYLASFLLASRRPYKQGDAVQINGHVGKVVGLDVRETILMTFEGNHVTIPNGEVFKATIVNFSRNPKRRFDFTISAAVQTDLAEAQQVGLRTLSKTKGVLQDPDPSAQIEGLGDSRVQIRFSCWIDQTKVDLLRVRSHSIRRVKVALECAGVELPAPMYRISHEGVAELPPVAKQPVTRSGIAPQLQEVEEGADHSFEDVAVDDTIDQQVQESQAREEAQLLDLLEDED